MGKTFLDAKILSSVERGGTVSQPLCPTLFGVQALSATVFSAFDPKASDSAFTIKDLPAPVSPVITVNPSKKGSSSSRTIA